MNEEPNTYIQLYKECLTAYQKYFTNLTLRPTNVNASKQFGYVSRTLKLRRVLIRIIKTYLRKEHSKYKNIQGINSITVATPVALFDEKADHRIQVKVSSCDKTPLKLFLSKGPNAVELVITHTCKKTLLNGMVSFLLEPTTWCGSYIDLIEAFAYAFKLDIEILKQSTTEVGINPTVNDTCIICYDSDNVVFGVLKCGCYGKACRRCCINYNNHITETKCPLRIEPADHVDNRYGKCKKCESTKNARGYLLTGYPSSFCVVCCMQTNLMCVIRGDLAVRKKECFPYVRSSYFEMRKTLSTIIDYINVKFYDALKLNQLKKRLTRKSRLVLTIIYDVLSYYNISSIDALPALAGDVFLRRAISTYVKYIYFTINDGDKRPYSIEDVNYCLADVLELRKRISHNLPSEYKINSEATSHLKTDYNIVLALLKPDAWCPPWSKARPLSSFHTTLSNYNSLIPTENTYNQPIFNAEMFSSFDTRTRPRFSAFDEDDTELGTMDPLELVRYLIEEEDPFDVVDV